MPSSREELYKFHVKNLRSLDQAYTQIYRHLKHCIASDDDHAADVLLKMQMFLIGAWSEVRLLKLLHEPAGFADNDLQRVLATPIKLDQWLLTLEIAYRRKYNVISSPLSAYTLPGTASLQYNAIRTIIVVDLKPIIEIRNKLAHGQWSRTLNSDLSAISSDHMIMLNNERALGANFKKTLLEYMANILNDLVASPEIFARDFDIHYDHLMQTKQNLDRRSYQEWRNSLQSKFARGRQKRAGA